MSKDAEDQARIDRRIAKYTAHRDMLAQEGIVRFIPPFDETVVLDEVRLRKINGRRVNWKWRALGLTPPRWEMDGYE